MARMPRFAGVATFMRLPQVSDPAEVEIALVGVPFDGGTTNRAGARHGPRQMREMSTLMRRVHPVSKTEPFRLARCADLGDVALNPIDLDGSLAAIEGFFDTLVKARVTPLAAGGDHLISLPILRALARKTPLGLVHIDAHSDTTDSYFGGSRYTHGTPFRRAIEEQLIDPRRTVQIGIRGSLHERSDLDWPLAQGVRIITMEDFEILGVEGTLGEIWRVVGVDPAYVSFDVDWLDPVYAPGTGTPEVGGLTTREAQHLLRGLHGMNLVGGDVVEVSPPYDPSGGTALVGATMMFEILCVLAEAVAHRRAIG
ncbi:MAG: agmatinase [Alphaproteobacteria bacterium]|nr:agmatinase [Alphaproteobacteria bacterium]